MPNWVQNRLTIGGDYQPVLDFLKTEDSVMDFNKIVPMPIELNIDASSLGDEGMKLSELEPKREYLSFIKLNELNKLARRLKENGTYDKAIALGSKYISNKVKYGYTNWYDWCCDNWGTKWNASSCELTKENTIEFKTAWAGVTKLIVLLSGMFPNNEFHYMHADEDTGRNCGIVTIKKSCTIEANIVSGSIQAYEIAFELWPGKKDYYELIDGEYVYKDEEV